MGGLVFLGFELIICAAIGFIFFIIGLFLQKIIVFDSIALGLIAGFLSHSFWNFHPVLAVLTGAAVCGIFIVLQMTSVGFWIIGILFSVLWGFIFGFIAWSVTAGNPFWTYGVWVGGGIVILLLHKHARENMRV